MPAPGKRGHISNRDGAAPFRSRPAGVSDSKVVHWLRRLDQKLPELETSIDSLIAAHLRVNPDLSDDDIVRRIRGLDNPARVAKVRGLLAAGRGAPTPKASESLSLCGLASS